MNKQTNRIGMGEKLTSPRAATRFSKIHTIEESIYTESGALDFSLPAVQVLTFLQMTTESQRQLRSTSDEAAETEFPPVPIAAPTSTLRRCTV